MRAREFVDRALAGGFRCGGESAVGVGRRRTAASSARSSRTSPRAAPGRVRRPTAASPLRSLLGYSAVVAVGIGFWIGHVVIDVCRPQPSGASSLQMCTYPVVVGA